MFLAALRQYLELEDERVEGDALRIREFGLIGTGEERRDGIGRDGGTRGGNL